MAIVYSDVREHGSSSSTFLSQDALAIYSLSSILKMTILLKAIIDSMQPIKLPMAFFTESIYFNCLIMLEVLITSHTPLQIFPNLIGLVITISFKLHYICDKLFGVIRLETCVCHRISQEFTIVRTANR